MAVSETHLVLPTVQVFLLGFPCSFEVFSYHFVNSGTTAEILVQQQVPQLKWQISVIRMISFTIFLLCLSLSTVQKFQTVCKYVFQPFTTSDARQFSIREIILMQQLSYLDTSKCLFLKYS